MYRSLSAIFSLRLHYTHLMFIHSDSLSRLFCQLLRLSLLLRKMRTTSEWVTKTTLQNRRLHYTTVLLFAAAEWGTEYHKNNSSESEVSLPNCPLVCCFRMRHKVSQKERFRIGGFNFTTFLLLAAAEWGTVCHKENGSESGVSITQLFSCAHVLI
jgi:hypothetical protein